MDSDKNINKIVTRYSAHRSDRFRERARSIEKEIDLLSERIRNQRHHSASFRERKKGFWNKIMCKVKSAKQLNH